MTLGIVLGGFVWAWLTVPFAIRSKQEARRLGLHRIPVAIRETMRVSIWFALIAIVLVGYKSRGYGNPFTSIWPWAVLFPITVGVLAFVWGFIVSPYFSESGKRRSLKQRVARLKLGFTAQDRMYQVQGWDQPTRHEHSSLFMAAAGEDIVRVHDLVYAGANIDVPESCGWTPLMIAAANRDEKTVRLLLELGANPNSANLRGRTPLMFASRYGFEDIARALVQGGADVNRIDFAGSPNRPRVVAAEVNFLGPSNPIVASGGRVIAAE